MSKNQNFPGYIDHNGNLTTHPLIGHSQKAHGSEEIGKKLISLLQKKYPTDTESLYMYQDIDNDINKIIDFYRQEIGENIIAEKKQRVFLGQDGMIEELSEEAEAIIDYPGEMMRYSISFPIWYLIAYYIDSFELLAGKQPLSIEFYKTASQKELLSLLNSVI